MLLQFTVIEQSEMQLLKHDVHNESNSQRLSVSTRDSYKRFFTLSYIFPSSGMGTGTGFSCF